MRAQIAALSHMSSARIWMVKRSRILCLGRWGDTHPLTPCGGARRGTKKAEKAPVESAFRGRLHGLWGRLLGASGRLHGLWGRLLGASGRLHGL